MHENTTREELLADLEKMRLENQELKGTLCRYRYVDFKFMQVDQQLVSNHHYLNTLLSLLPIGVSICTDTTCQDIRHNPEAANFLRIKEWEKLSHSAENPTDLKLYHNGEIMSPHEMPIQRSIWFGEYIRKIEIEFLWADGICKTSLLSSIPLYDQKGIIMGAIAVFEDITERKLTENLLLQKTQETQQQLAEIEEIYKTVPIGLCLLDKDLRYRRINQRLAEINGLSIEDHIGKTPLDVTPGLAGLEKTMRSVMEEGKPLFNLEVSVTDSDKKGRMRFWNQSLLPYRDKYGNIIGLSVTAEEITEQKQIEKEKKNYVDNLEKLVKERTVKLSEINEELRISEERFRLALANSPTQVFNQDRELRYTWFYNLSSEYTMAEVIGKTDGDLFPCENNQEYIAVKRSVIKTGISDRKVVKLNMKTGIFYYDLFIYPLFDVKGLVTGITCVSTDITNRKKAEEALRQSEERFSRVFRSSPVMMAIINKETAIFIDANEAWLRTFGFDLQKILNAHISSLKNGNRDLHEKLFLRSRKEAIYNYEISFMDINGNNRFGLASSEIIQMNGHACILQTILDITDKRQFEQEMSRLERLHSIGEMAASIGHEIRNPLTSIRGFLQLLCNDHPNQDDQIYYELMIEELDRANEIITEFLGMAKDKEVNLQRYSLDTIVNDLFPIIQSDANHKDMNVKLDLNQPPEPLIDKNEIKQLLLNLSRNGLDAMSTGGTLTIGTYVENQDIVLYIKDEGSGLSPYILDKLGTPFLTTKETGTGLGLAVCYSIAARHHAHIHYRTGENGTTFYIHFPLSS